MSEAHCTIVLIEDERDLRDTLKEILEMEGYRVVTAENGEIGLQRLQELRDTKSPCLILLDLMMPVMNGWQFLDTLREKHQEMLSRIPIAIVSAASDVAGVQASFGCSYIRKPINMTDLFKVAKEHCMPC